MLPSGHTPVMLAFALAVAPGISIPRAASHSPRRRGERSFERRKGPHPR
jgi:hypothetical protein